VVVAAGAGTRFGGPKQYLTFGGRRVLDWSVSAARTLACRPADGIVLVVPAARAGEVEVNVDAVVAGGPTRSASVRAGLAAVPATADVIVVHDAARPLASPALFSAVVAALADADVDGAVPGIAVTDTVKRVRDGRVTSTLDRSELVAVQTPQAFRGAVLRRAHAGLVDATDDAALVEGVGGRIVVVPGEASNVKVTTAADLETLSRFHV
jgi:2-C-methyl-D-erythritol 4-phosphate cytidylyltransferase